MYYLLVFETLYCLLEWGHKHLQVSAQVTTLHLRKTPLQCLLEWYFIIFFALFFCILLCTVELLLCLILHLTELQ